MVSEWHNPLPSRGNTVGQAVVYYYSDFWIPITCFSYSEAIALHQKALRQGKEILVFPSGLKLETKNILLAKSESWQDELVMGLT